MVGATDSNTYEFTYEDLVMLSNSDIDKVEITIAGRSWQASNLVLTGCLTPGMSSPLNNYC